MKLSIASFYGIRSLEHTETNQFSVEHRTVTMVRVVKLFQTVQNFYRTNGFHILPTQSQHQSSMCPLNGKMFLLLFFPAQLFILSAAFFLFEAQTADENGLSFYMSISVLASTINVLNVVWKIDKILTLIDRYEEFIDKRWFR